ANAWQNGIKVFENILNGTSVDSTAKIDTSAIAKTDSAKATRIIDSIKNINASKIGQKKISDYLQLQPPSQDNGKIYYPAAIGSVAVKDSAAVRTYLENPAFKSLFPSDVVWLYGTPTINDKTKRKSDRIPLYA